MFDVEMKPFFCSCKSLIVLKVVKWWSREMSQIKMFNLNLLNKPGTRGRLRKGLQIPMDGLTDWQTERLKDWRTYGLTDWSTEGRRVKYLREYVLRCKRGTLKNPGEIFSKNLPNHFWKKIVQWKRVGLNLRYNFGTGGIFWTKWQRSNICLHKLKLRIF